MPNKMPSRLSIKTTALVKFRPACGALLCMALKGLRTWCSAGLTEKIKFLAIKQFGDLHLSPLFLFLSCSKAGSN